MKRNQNKSSSVCGRLASRIGIAAVIGLGLAGCTTTTYLEIVESHSAAEVLSDNVQVFEGASYDDAVVQAGEAGFEVILSSEGRNKTMLGFLFPKVRVIAKDADGIRPGDSAAASTVDDSAAAVE